RGNLAASGHGQQPGFGDSKAAHVDPIGELCRVGLVMVSVHDEPRRTQLGEPIDHREAVAMAGRCLVAHQHIEAMLPEPGKILRKDRITMPERQAATPVLAWLQAVEERGAGGEARRVDTAAGLVGPRMPDAWLEYAAEASDAQAVYLGHLAADVAFGEISDEIVECRRGLGVLVADDPTDLPANVEQRRQHSPQRLAQVAVAQQDQSAGIKRRAGSQDRWKIAVRVAGDDDWRGHATAPNNRFRAVYLSPSVTSPGWVSAARPCGTSARSHARVLAAPPQARRTAVMIQSPGCRR